ncbi:MAG: hypothetical protein Q4C95_10035, partial [Planctomycetia bacterium]|nr:hypothetical protein [Planctomycetia bacterium]
GESTNNGNYSKGEVETKDNNQPNEESSNREQLSNEEKRPNEEKRFNEEKRSQEDKLSNIYCRRMNRGQQFFVEHIPSDVAVRTDENGRSTIYVTLQFMGKVISLDAATGLQKESWSVGREPFSMEITPNGRFLVIANLLPEHQADVSFITCAVYVVDLQEGTSHRIELLNGIVGLKQIAISPDGKYAFITGAVGNYLTVTSQVVGGWITENLFAAIDIESQQLIDVFYLDDTTLGAGNPWGITCSDDGQFLAVTIAGTDEVILLPYERIEKMLIERPLWNRPGYGSYTYSYQGQGEIKLPFRLRVKLGLKGMRRIIMRGNNIYVNGYYEDAIGKIGVHINPPFEHYSHFIIKPSQPPKPVHAEDFVFMRLSESVDVHNPSVNIDTNVNVVPNNISEPKAFGPFDVFDDSPEQGDHYWSDIPFRLIELEPLHLLKGVDFVRSIAYLNGSKPQWTQERRGEVLFHDATICMEHWISCITCHPDGRVDGLNWDLMNDGVGNPKNTKSLLLSHETPPSMISGIRPDAETAVRAGVIHILFSSLSEEDYCAMDEYLKKLRQVPSPFLIKGKLSESAQRGRFLFESSRTGCSTCHPEPLYTDLSFHNVHSSEYYDNISKFDTPTLSEVWRTAPYLNTGHYRTIRELLIDGKHGNQDGILDKLSDQELNDLIEFVLSL